MVYSESGSICVNWRLPGCRLPRFLHRHMLNPFNTFCSRYLLLTNYYTAKKIIFNCSFILYNFHCNIEYHTTIKLLIYNNNNQVLYKYSSRPMLVNTLKAVYLFIAQQNFIKTMIYMYLKKNF